MPRPTNIRYISIGPGGGPPAGGLLGRIAALLVGIVVLGLSVFLGAIVLAGIVGFMLIGGLIMMLRVWWIKRKMEQYTREHGDLDAEYTVIKEESRRD